MNQVTFQRLEGLAVFIASTVFYFYTGLAWWAYPLFILTVDVFMIGYLANPKLGAVIYNIGHSYTLPSLLAVLALITGNDLVTGTACIWLAHIGMDRAFGFGLKLPTGFKQTHLGKIGSKDR